jgi:hypothetical protein
MMMCIIGKKTWCNEVEAKGADDVAVFITCFDRSTPRHTLSGQVF